MSQSNGERSESERYREAASLETLAPPELYHVAKLILGDPEWRIRRAGWESLLRANIDPRDRVLFLLENLEDSDNAGARGAALEALIQLGEAGVQFLVELLPGRSPRGKRFILDVLSQVKSPLAVESARSLLFDEDENIGFAAAEVLGSTGTAADAHFILATIDKVSGSRRFAFLAAVVQIAKRFPLQFEHSLLDSFLDDPILRGPAIELLGLSSTDEAGEALWNQIQLGKSIDGVLLALSDLLAAHSSVQLAADAQKFAMILERCRLSNVSSATRQAAFRVIASTHPAHLGPLIPILAEEDSEWLAESLARLPLKAIRDLIPAISLGEKGRTVAAMLYRRVPELHGESALLSLLNQPGEHRFEALAALASAGGIRSIPHLLSLCSASDSSIADRAAESLFQVVKRGVRGFEDKLLNMLESAAPDLAVRLLPTLGLLFENEACAEVLCLLMRNSEPTVRCAAVNAAEASAGRPEIAGLLVSRLTDEDDEVRSAAAQMIGASGVREAIGSLQVLLDDPNPWVQASALNALAALQEWPGVEKMLVLLRRGGMIGVAAARIHTVHRREGDFANLVAILPDVDSDVAAELLKALSLFESDVAPELLSRLHQHTDWNLRAAVVHYVSSKRRDWMIELARSWIQGESDEWVRYRLTELVGA